MECFSWLCACTLMWTDREEEDGLAVWWVKAVGVAGLTPFGRVFHEVGSSQRGNCALTEFASHIAKQMCHLLAASANCSRCVTGIGTVSLDPDLRHLFILSILSLTTSLD